MKRYREQTLSFNLETRSKHDALVQSFVASARSGGGVVYSRPDCEELLQRARATRRQDELRLAKIARLSRRGKSVREGGLLRAHKQAWEKEQARLERAREQVERELEEWREHVISGEDQFWRTFLPKAAAVEELLDTARQDFLKSSVQPLLSARAHLKSHLAEERKGGDVMGVWEGVGVVKQQSNEVQTSLRDEFDEAESEMTDIEDMEDQSMAEDSVIPRELLEEREGVDPASYDAALRQVQLLDHYYHQSLASLHHQCHETASRQESEWSKEEAERFCHVVGQYPASLMRRRTLLIDRLMREFPCRSRAEIVDRETWFNAESYYKKQVTCLKKSWQQNKTEMVQRLLAVLRERRECLQSAAITCVAREEERRKAEDLYRKVCVWREEREAAHGRQEAERAREREREEEERWREEQKMAEHRNKLKTKLKMYQGQKRREREREEEEGQRRRREREMERKEEEERGRERMGYRQQLIRERCVREEEARERAMEAVRERQRRLEQLRKTVEIKAATDPLRILKPTKASEMRLHHNMTDTQLDTQHPLFTLHGYHDDVVTSDPRYRVTAALKEAGLLQSDYARHVLASVQGSFPPRHDQKSSIF